MDKSNELLHYVQDLYNYYAVAAAVAIVLSKPKGKTIEDCLCTLQDNLAVTTAAVNQVCTSACPVQDDSQEVATDSAYGSQDWDFSSSQQDHDQNTRLSQQGTVSQLQQSLQTASNTADCSEVPNTVCDSDYFGTNVLEEVLSNLRLDNKMNCRTNIVEEDVVESCDEQENFREAAVANARFIYSLIGLGFAARKQAYVPASTVSHYLSMAPADVAKDLNTNLLGNGETGTIVNSNIASSFIQYHTQNTHEHLLQCVDRAVEALGTLILDKRSRVVKECFNSWENSPEHYVVDNLCSALDFLCDGGSDSAQCISSSIELVKSFLQNVLQAEDDDEFVMWEQQCGMMLKVVSNRHMCGRVLSLLVENIQQLADSVKLGASLATSEYVKKMHRSASTQTRSFYIFSLTEDLLLAYKEIHRDILNNCKEGESAQETQQDASSVDGLWRNAFNIENDNSELRNSRQLISSWKASLAQSAMTFTNHDANLLSIYAWSCVDQVKNLQ